MLQVIAPFDRLLERNHLVVMYIMVMEVLEGNKKFREINSIEVGLTSGLHDYTKN